MPVRDAIAKCPVETYVVIGSLDLLDESKRVGASVFLDAQHASPLARFEPPVTHFEIPVRFDTLVRGPFLIFGHDCSRKPRELELVITDGEHVVFRRQLSVKDLSIVEETRPRRIELGHIRLRPPA
jgi:hypothetical protein